MRMNIMTIPCAGYVLSRSINNIVSSFKLNARRKFCFEKHSSNLSTIISRQRLRPKTGHVQLFSSILRNSEDTRNIQTKQVNFSDGDTIFALSSGGGGSSATAVSVIRLSGSSSIQALDRLLNHPNLEKSQKIPKTRYAAVRDLYDPRDGSLLDQSLVLVFQGPRSFTGEDIVEIHCHGSRAVVNGILESLGYLGEENSSASLKPLSIRPADRGEFTQRAFDKGKMNLVQVEALADLIVADTSLQRKQALNQLGGSLSDLYDSWRKDLTKGLAHAEAVIDFGDDEDLSADNDMDHDAAQQDVWVGVRSHLSNLRRAMEHHLTDKERGEIVRDGVRVAIIGPPNAGKSSLLNLLAQREAAIVSPIAGTTRDVVEIVMDLGGVRCIVSDTAGMRSQTDDIIEVEGIRRARAAASQSHVAVFVVDAATKLDNEVQKTLSTILPEEKPDGTLPLDYNQRTMLVANKIDLVSDPTSEVLELLSAQLFPDADAFGISCVNGLGVEAFVQALTARVIERVAAPEEESSAVITRARHRRHVQNCVAALRRYEILSQQGFMAVDMAAEELRLASTELGRIVGAIDVEDILDVLFADFCIGK